MESKSDERLLADHLSDVPGAFDCLAKRYVHELFAFLHRFVGNRAVADDLVQETFLQVHLAAASFDPARKFRPWLYTIAANKGRDYLRARGRHYEASLDATAPHDDGPSPAQAIPAADSGAPAQAEAQERAKTVRALINRMPEHLRLILVLGYYQQLPYAQIAEVLEIPVGTVKSRLHSAVNHFARLWHAYADTASAAEP